MSDVRWVTYDWRHLVQAAEPRASYYDEYRFSGRRFTKRDETNYTLHEATNTPPSYVTVPDNEN